MMNTSIRIARSSWAVSALAILLVFLAGCGDNTASVTTTAATSGASSGTTTSAGTAVAPSSGTSAATTAPASNGTAATTSQGNVQPGTIQVAVVKGTMLDTMTKLAKSYEQAHSGSKVNVVEEPEGGAFDALIAAGNQPDMFVASFGSEIGKYAGEQAAIPLETLPGAQDLIAKVDPTTLKQVYGHTYYMPIGADITMMIYNKDLFQQAGLDPSAPPKTWDDFLADAQKIQALPAQNNNKIYGTVFWNDALTFGGWYWNMLQPIYLNGNQNQCELLNKLGTDIVYDKPECKMQDFFTFAKKAQQYAPPTMEKNFFSRTIGMWPQYGYSWEPNLKEAAGKPMVIGQDVGIAPVPTPQAGQTSYSTYGGRGLMIMKTTPDRQARAWDFIQFLMQDQNNLQFIKELGYLPTLKSLQSDPYFIDPTRKPFVDAEKTAVFPQMFATADNVANSILGVYQQTVVQGSLPADQAVQQAATKGRQALQKAS